MSVSADDQQHKQKSFEKLLSHLLGPDLISFQVLYGEMTIWVYPASIVRVLTVLSNYHDFGFKQLIDITAVDYPERERRFDLVYHLLSLFCNQRIRVKFSISEQDAVPTVTPVFVNANWYEREVWDLFGIVFSDHPDLRRILTDYTFSGHPLRKDFPLTGYTQVRYCDEQKKVIYEPLHLDQPYRSFDFVSPWEGMMAPHTLSNSPAAPDLLADVKDKVGLPSAPLKE